MYRIWKKRDEVYGDVKWVLVSRLTNYRVSGTGFRVQDLGRRFYILLIEWNIQSV